MSMTYELLSSTEPKMAEAQNMDLSKEEEYTAPEHCTQMEESNKASKKTAKRKIQFDLPKEGNSSKQKEDKKTTASDMYLPVFSLKGFSSGKNKMF